MLKISDFFFGQQQGGNIPPFGFEWGVRIPRTPLGGNPASTFRQACGFKIRIKASPNGQKLVVADVVKIHNHEVTKSFFELLPSQRKLDKETKKKAKEMLDVKANKKMVQQYLTEKTGKVVLLKDVHNMQASEVRQKIKPQEELQQLCSWLNSARIQPSKDSYSVNHQLKPSLKKSALVFWKTL